MGVFPFAFHIAVQQPFKPLLSRLLLYDLEPTQASFALCFKSLLMTLLPESEEFLSKFPSSRYLSSSGSYPLDLSGLGDPAGRNATVGLALRVEFYSKNKFVKLVYLVGFIMRVYHYARSPESQNIYTCPKLLVEMRRTAAIVN